MNSIKDKRHSSIFGTLVIETHTKVTQSGPSRVTKKTKEYIVVPSLLSKALARFPYMGLHEETIKILINPKQTPLFERIIYSVAVLDPISAYFTSPMLVPSEIPPYERKIVNLEILKERKNFLQYSITWIIAYTYIFVTLDLAILLLPALICHVMFMNYILQPINPWCKNENPNKKTAVRANIVADC